MVIKKITCTAPVNVAVIKYWGKANEDLIIPANDSISFTLSQDEMCAKTTIVISPLIKKSCFWLNGKEETMDNPRIFNCIQEVRRRAKKQLQGSNGDASILNWKMHISSTNNFPTAAGLASSAAGFACLIFTLAKIYGIEGDLSPIARLGSGSACRSIYSGIVQWEKGSSIDGTDSVAKQIAPLDHWNNLHVIICVASDKKKKIGSSEGMKLSLKTSELMTYRIKYTVNKRIADIKKAIENKDWGTFCDITMADSNEMHAICLNTFPPCVYMNDTSHELCSFVHFYNKHVASLELEKICYTFDAGPNCCLFVHDSAVETVAALLDHCFPSSFSTTKMPSETYWTGIPFSQPFIISKDTSIFDRSSNVHGIKYFIHTKIGDGPKIAAEANNLPDGFHTEDS